MGVFKADAQREFAVDYNSKINVVFFSSSNQMRRLSSGLKLSFPCDSNDILTRSRDSNGFSSFFSNSEISSLSLKENTQIFGC